MERSKHSWSKVFLLGFLGGIGVAVVFYAFLHWQESKQVQHPMPESIGFYTWDLSQHFPPGSPEARRIADQFPIEIRNLKTDYPIYFRLPSQGVTADASSILAWDYELTDGMLKQWQEEIRSEQTN